MAVDLLPGEQVLWQGAPVRRTPFLRTDSRWLWFHLKFDLGLLVLVAVVVVPLALWWDDDLTFLWPLVTAWVAMDVLRVAEPFIWRYLTLPRTTYYVTDQRVVAVRGRRVRTTQLGSIDELSAAVAPDGSGHVKIDRRISPDGFLQATVAELIHVPDAREVVMLLSTLTGQQASYVD
ncbi:hypothetical protein [Lentzea guizhouensis]|uniref:hypothetical protein n=1 Tax=Lentzea guizhouensis TaxID=1586287 RepID=UPI0012B683B7|nr:hypothetical protein [Lentzea guizhouensis]